MSDLESDGLLPPHFDHADAEDDKKGGDDDKKGGDDDKKSGDNEKSDDDKLVIELSHDIYSAIGAIYSNKVYSGKKKLIKFERRIIWLMVILTAFVQLSCAIFLWVAPVIEPEEAFMTTSSHLVFLRIVVCIGMNIYVSKAFGDILGFYIICHNKSFSERGKHFIFGAFVNFFVSGISSIYTVYLVMYKNNIEAIFGAALMIFFILEIDDWAFVFISKMSFVFQDEDIMFKYPLKEKDITEKCLLNPYVKTTYLFGTFIIITVLDILALFFDHLVFFAVIMGGFWWFIGFTFLGRYIYKMVTMGNKLLSNV